MKKFLTVLSVGALLLALVSCASSVARANVVVNQGVPAGVMLNADVAVTKLTTHPDGFVGGWTKNDSMQIDEMARDAFVKATENLGVKYRPIALEATQVVAGLNYCFLAEVSTNGASEYQLVYIYRDISGNCSLIRTENL